MVKRIKNNNKGVTFVEIIIVVALMVILTTVSAGPIINVYKARAKSAATEISAMLSQCKINALSGISNEMRLWYDADVKEYKCALYKVNTSGIAETETYKIQTIGNQNLDISIGSSSIKDGTMTVRFNNQTGAVSDFSFEKQNLKDNLVNTIKVVSSKTYKIDIFTTTGNQEAEFVG